jgi:hypothetical protein
VNALTLWQPHATLMAIGAKKIETRSWDLPARVAGAWVAIHAASFKSVPISVLRSVLADPAITTVLRSYAIDPAKLPYGAIVAVAHLTRALPTTSLVGKVSPQEAILGDYSAGRFGWMTADVIPLLDPVLCKGAQGLWPLGLHTETQVHADLTKQGRDITGIF